MSKTVKRQKKLVLKKRKSNKTQKKRGGNPYDENFKSAINYTIKDGLIRKNYSDGLKNEIKKYVPFKDKAIHLESENTSIGINKYLEHSEKINGEDLNALYTVLAHNIFRKRVIANWANGYDNVISDFGKIVGNIYLDIKDKDYEKLQNIKGAIIKATGIQRNDEVVLFKKNRNLRNLGKNDPIKDGLTVILYLVNLVIDEKYKKNSTDENTNQNTTDNFIPPENFDEADNYKSPQTHTPSPTPSYEEYNNGRPHNSVFKINPIHEKGSVAPVAPEKPSRSYRFTQRTSTREPIKINLGLNTENSGTL